MNRCEISASKIAARIRISDTGCWVWTGTLDFKGYGVFHKCKAHRVVYEHFNGRIPDGLVTDHLCRNKACVNPSHLEPVTNRENILRGINPAARNSRKTHCIRGHDLSLARVAKSGRRNCMTCVSINRSTEQYKAHRAALWHSKRKAKEIAHV